MKLIRTTKLKKTLSLVVLVISILLVSSCAVSPETQAKMDEFARTIPSCLGDEECARKWATARQWTQANSDFNIRGDSNIRINASNNVISQSGIGVVINRIENASGGFQIVADLECFSAYSCPELWDLKIDFNRTVNNTP